MVVGMAVCVECIKEKRPTFVERFLKLSRKDSNLTGGTRIRRATITPQGKVSCHFDVAKVRTFFEPTNVFLLFLEKKGRIGQKKSLRL